MITILQPGLIHIRQALSRSEQLQFAHIALKNGDDPQTGFWKINDIGEKVLNQAPHAPHRGRMYKSLNDLPKLAELSDRFTQIAIEKEPTVKSQEATHAIILYYKTLDIAPPSGYIAWHSDKDPNDGDKEMPVISFNIGDTCEFLVCNEKPKISRFHPIDNPANLAHKIRLLSGDALIFLGPSRKIYHSIFKIYKNTAPSFLSFLQGRLNYTFRCTPELINHEDKFLSSNFKSVYSQANVTNSKAS